MIFSIVFVVGERKQGKAEEWNGVS